MRTELNNLRVNAEYIEIKSLMNKVSWKKTTGMDTVRFEEKNYRAETSRSTIHFFSPQLIEQIWPRIYENLHIFKSMHEFKKEIRYLSICKK